MVIVQRWTKVETLLESIIRNTLNDDKEVANLEISRKAVKSLIKSSETILTEFEYTGKLREFAMRLNVSDTTTGTTMMSLSSNTSSDEMQLLNELNSPNAKLINHGRLYANPMVSGCGLQYTTRYHVLNPFTISLFRVGYIDHKLAFQHLTLWRYGLHN
ncbi:unnamed protein product [Schistosoma mattheei]|uniref:PH-like domain-containing protein n=1 Tax=Schistosoma mattheei TaxID=31246 RepID=A0A183PQ40_9TREM|nr:unnamed protein product [Schistosoma mattheei]